MDKVNWSDDFLIGIEFFDNQHKHMIKLLDQLIAASDNPSLSEVSEALLTELMDATTRHFKDEEEFMAKHDFPTLADHKAHHDEFLGKAKDLHRLSILAEKPVPVNLVIFLKKWLVEHILFEDKKYLVCAQENSTE
jgi:hemerythrin-like metal-binding protein